MSTHKKNNKSIKKKIMHEKNQIHSHTDVCLFFSPIMKRLMLTFTVLDSFWAANMVTQPDTFGLLEF